jgi:hypothetical protein
MNNNPNFQLRMIPIVRADDLKDTSILGFTIYVPKKK